jgi:dimethylhistidine N-methyltransferase
MKRALASKASFRMKSGADDLSPSTAEPSFREAVLHGLSQPEKSLPPKFFYDLEGSRLFEKITTLPEYYLTHTEEEILAACAGEVAELAGPGCRLIELGSGNSRKTRLLLDALLDVAQYVPIDISASGLQEAEANLKIRYPDLHVVSLHADYTGPLHLPPLKRTAQRNLAFFPGSTLGNFEPHDARAFLRRVRTLGGPGGLLLLGVDLRKDPLVLHAAYNDAEGVTAAFNLHLLERMNAELGANFRLESFRHYAIYEPVAGRIAMYLVSLKSQDVEIGEARFHFERGEPIRTEYSYKYTRPQLAAMAAEAGFAVQKVWTDRKELFSVQFLRATRMPRPT